MSSIRHLRIAAGAGEPDSVPALRIDIIAAAVAWYDAEPDDYAVILIAADKLNTAVRRYKSALEKRKKERT